MGTEELRGFPLLKGLDEAELGRVAELGERREVAAGTQVFAAGDPPDAFYLIEAGTVRVVVPASPDGPEKRVELKPGSFFGEIGMLRDVPRTAGATVVADGALRRYDRAAFDELLSIDEGMARKVATAARDRLGEFRASHGGAKEPRVLLFMSTGGREGASFLTANLAVKQAIATGQPTLAVDMNFPRPGLQRYLSTLSNLGSFSRIFEADVVTGAVIREAAAALPLGVHLLAGSGTGSIALTPAHVEAILPRTREAFEWVLLDPGPSRNVLTAAAARFCDVAHVVCEPTEESIGRADEQATWLREQGLEGRVRFVLNKVPTDRAPELDPAVIKQVLGDDLIGTIHHSGTQARQGVVAGSPVVVTHPRSGAATEVTGLARALVAQPAGPLERLRRLLLWTLGFDT